jgi:hypothetical protein
VNASFRLILLEASASNVAKSLINSILSDSAYASLIFINLIDASEAFICLSIDTMSEYLTIWKEGYLSRFIGGFYEEFLRL